MSRHHPYGGYDQGPPPRRRSASPPYRGRGRGGVPGGGRGRGGRGAYAGPSDSPYASSYASHAPYGSSTGYPSDYASASDYPPPAPASIPGPPMMGASDPYMSYPPSGGPYEDYGYSSYRGGSGGPAYDDRDPRDYRDDYGARPAPYDDRGPPPGPPDYRRGGYDDDDDQDRGGYNDRGGRGGPASGGRGRGRRVARDDKVHDSIIEERINRERPCRTLFIRNIKYESSSEEMRTRFASYGEIKTFFDLIKTRGMVFVTYHDLRDAERAREQLQGFEVSGRPIDVHYSLPRDFEVAQRCDRDKNQGTLKVSLINSPTRQILDDNEVRRKFQQFGDVKSVKPVPGRPDQRYVELFDSRACATAHDRLRDQSLQDGIMVLEFEWDIPDQPVPHGAMSTSGAHSPGRFDDPTYRSGPGSDRGAPSSSRDRGPPPPRGGRSMGGGGGRDDWDRRPPPPSLPPIDPRDRDRDRDYRNNDRRGSGYVSPPPPERERGGYREAPRDPRFKDYPRDSRDYGRSASGSGPPPPPPASGPGRGGMSSAPSKDIDEFGRERRAGYDDRERDRDRDSYSRGGPSDGYPPMHSSNAAPFAPGPSTARGPPPANEGATVDDRLEQAMKVQQLLAALKPNGAAPAAQPPAPAPAAAPYYAPMNSGPAGYGSYPSSAAPPGNFPPFPPNMGPAPGGYGAPSSAPNGTASGGGASSVAGMQNLLALLAQNQQQR